MVRSLVITPSSEMVDEVASHLAPTVHPYLLGRHTTLTYYAGRRVRPAVGGLRYAARRPDGTHRQDGQTHPQGGVTRWA